MVHKEFVSDGKTVNAEFYKGIIYRLLKRIQRVRPAALCSWDFFCTIRRTPTKLQVFANFWPPKKCYNPLSPPPHPPTPYSPDLSPQEYFLLPKLKMKLKGLHFADVAEIQEAVNWWIKARPKRGIFGSFSETVRPCKKPVYMPTEIILNWKRVFSSPIFDFLKKISHKTFGPHIYIKISVRRGIFIRKSNSLTLRREIMATFSDNHMNIGVHCVGKIQNF